MEKILLGIYGVALVMILVYSLVQLNLVVNYLKGRRRNNGEGLKLDTSDPGKVPRVTVQLPVFNEMYVVERLIEAITKFEYPRDKLQIQVLDDSTDETTSIAEQKVSEFREKGLNIEYIHRADRFGFKAGALDHGLNSAKGEFVAVFDADFIPSPDFLINTIPYFLEDSKVGVVQTRWGHINKNYSLLTRLQAFGLDAHFSVEQGGRNAGKHFINFNGTAGIWRKSCIEDAGGWHHDTLTEDLDLSYRAQLKGWQFRYLEHVVADAELPVVMSALKNQQFRWTKGGAENFIKMRSKIWNAGHIPLKTRVHAFFHLLNSSIFLCVFTTALFSIPILFIKNSYPEYNTLFNISSLFLICTFLLMVFYWYSFNEHVQGIFKKRIRFFRFFVLFLSTSMGLSFHNSVAVMEGYMGRKSSFIRTPKFNIKTLNDKWQGNKYLVSSINFITLMEGLFAAYFLFGILSGIYLREYGLLPFHIMLFWGFGYVFVYSILSVKK